ncbi:MAG: hypothetical protein V7745_07010 [Pseudomonadales bacterium]
MESKPWLNEKKWAENHIISSAKMQHYFLWGFAVVWLLLTSPILFNFDEIWGKAQREPITAIAFLFPLVGVGLLVAAFRSTQNWLKFGRTPLVLDPFPGALGGHVGGSIETAIAYDPDMIGNVTLQCLHSYVSGSGKNRSRKENVKWQTDGVCHVSRGQQGAIFSFRFDAPDNLPITDVEKGSSYHLWRVVVSSKLDGPDFSRSYEIPVFKTGATSAALQVGTEDHHATVDAAMAGVESIANIKAIPGGLQAYFPAFQRPSMGVFTLIFGLVFMGAGIGAGYAGAPLIFPVIFTLVGGLIALFGVYYLGKSLFISVTNEGVKSRRFLFGYPLNTKQIEASQIAKLEIKEGATMSSGSKTTVYYQLVAESKDGQKLQLAERLTSRAEVELLKESFEAYLSLSD